MSQRRLGRILFALFVVAALFVIGRNMYHRHLDAALAVAVDKGNLADVRSLLDKGANVDATQYALPLLALALTRLPTPVTSAANAPSVAPSTTNYPDAEAIACLLISKQTDLRLPHTLYRNGRQTITGYDAAGYIREACQYGSVPILRRLLEKGAKPTPDCLDSALRYQDDRYFGDAFYVLPETNQRGRANAAVAAENAKRQAQRTEISRQMASLLCEHGISPTPAQYVEMNDIAALKAKLDAATSQDAARDMASEVLAAAVSKNNRAMAALLLERGADVNWHGRNICTALCAAAYAGNREMVQWLLAHGAKTDIEGSSPLSYAVRGRRPEMVRLLLAHGTAPNPKSRLKTTSVLSNAIYNLPEVVPDLLRHGANVNFNNGAPLRSALRSHLTGPKKEALVTELLWYGANVNPPLLTQRATVSESQYSSDGKEYSLFMSSPLLNAVCFAPECLDILRKAGAAIGPEKQSVLAEAAHSGRNDLFAPLLAAGADINGVDADGETALMRAIVDAPAGVSLLIKQGATLNIITRAQRTPLILAVLRGDSNMVRRMLAQGADVNLHAPGGHTPLYWSQQHHHAVISKLLEQAGAKAE